MNHVKTGQVRGRPKAAIFELSTHVEKVWWGFDKMSVCMLACARGSLWLKNHFQNHVRKIVPPSPAMGKAAPWAHLSALKRLFGLLNFLWCRAEMGADFMCGAGEPNLAPRMRPQAPETRGQPPHGNWSRSGLPRKDSLAKICQEDSRCEHERRCVYCQ